MLISGGLLYGLVLYKAYAHLIAMIYLLVYMLAALAKFVMSFDAMDLPFFLVMLLGLLAAAYLNSKFVSDYKQDKDMLETDPELRENAIIFTE